MNLLDEIKAIPIINDHTHIFGCAKPDYDAAGRPGSPTPRGMVSGLGWANMVETAMLEAEKDQARYDELLMKLAPGRRTTYPARLTMRLYRELFGIREDDLTEANAPALIESMKATLPAGTDALYEYFSRVSNTEIWFANHGGPEDVEPRTTRGRFRWVPYFLPQLKDLDSYAIELHCERPRTADAIRTVLTAVLLRARKNGAVAIKSASAYNLDRPFAPDVASIRQIDQAIPRLESDPDDREARRIVSDALAVLTAEAAAVADLPVQIHVGLLWAARGPTRIPEIMELTPLFHSCPRTTFVVFHGAFPRTTELAHVAATMSNVRAEFNWMPVWAGLDFPRIMGQWIDMIPNDRIIYGTDGGGLTSVMHDIVSREGLAEALEERIRRGLLSRKLALEIAANIFRNNAIETYRLNLPRYSA